MNRLRVWKGIVGVDVVNAKAFIGAEIILRGIAEQRRRPRNSNTEREEHVLQFRQCEVIGTF